MLFDRREQGRGSGIVASHVEEDLARLVEPYDLEGSDIRSPRFVEKILHQLQAALGAVEKVT